MEELTGVQKLIASAPLRQVASLTFVFAVILVVRWVARAAIRKRIDDGAIRYKAQKGVSFFAALIIVLVLLAEFGGKASGLTVAVGAASAGIAFALQEVIASFAGWLAIAGGGFYTVGDRVQLGGIKGDVIDIGLLRTTIMEMGDWVKGDLYNGRIVRVANSFVFKAPVYNYSADFPFLWDEVTVPVKYGSDYLRARQILEAVAQEVCGEATEKARGFWDKVVRTYRVEPARIEPLVTLIANDNWVEFTVRYAVEFKARRITKDQLFTKILSEFEGTAGRVAFASMTVQLVEVPVFDVRVQPGSTPPAA
ncbi:MAG: mechanosensitive ion channel [Archangium sp.]|nr:mechanosensitive ion channel [Archangium sp.]MDP3155796.1 mechanosensitive ion channel [Archangium sp.]MDP3574038.1 mechanosensitive ion channel [Archangium sp.]